MSQKFLNPIEVDGQVSAEYLDLSTSTSHSVNAGEIAWNSIDGTFDIGLLNGVTLQAGQEMHFYGKATEDISNGNAVMFAGVQGDHILIAKADATTINANPEYFMGVATQNFTTNQFGYVTAFGNVRGLNTAVYPLGAVLYYDSTSTTDGLLTATEPSAPNVKIEVAAVVRVHATQGILMVRPHTMPKLKDIQDVNVDTATTGEILQLQSNGVWENKTLAEAGIQPLTENFTNVVYFNSTNPSTATIFDLNNPPVVNDNALKNNTANLYIGTDASTWVYKTTPAGYTTYVQPSSTPFFINGTTVDAGSNKTSIIYRNADVISNGVRIGRGSGNISTNTLIGGGGALSANTTGDNNVALGEYALGSNTTGTSNFGMGFASLGANTTGSFNVGLGRASLRWSTGSYNVGIGMQALSANGMTGSNNIGIGWLAGGSTTGNNNISLGSSSGGQTTGSRNITIGVDAKVVTATSDGQVNIGNSLFATGATSNSNASPLGNWGVGINNPSERLHVNGRLRLSTIDNGAGDFATISGTGVITRRTSSQTLSDIGAYAATNPNGYTSNTGTVTSVSGTGGYGGLTLTGTVATSGSLTLGGTPSGTWPISITGNAATATTLQTARTINGTSFNGSANIETSYWGATRTITIGNTGKTVNGSGNQSWSLAEIGAQAALTNPVTGTGTTNYVSKFTGATSLGNSQIFDNGTNVGIGTATPATKLEVQTSGSTESSIRIRQLTYNYWDLKSPSASSDFTIGDVGGEKMRITSTGKVGIGTSSPVEKLTISGNLATGGIMSIDTTSTTSFVRILADISSNNLLNWQTGTDLRFATSTQAYGSFSERMRINSSGNIGIGTSSPSEKLDVNGIIRGLMPNDPSSGGITAKFLSYSPNPYGLIFRGYASGAHSIQSQRESSVNELFPLILQPLGGNVGIATTSPNALLDVAGDALINEVTIGQGPVVGEGNTALGKGALGSMVGGKANIAVGSNANSDNDATGLTVIGVDLNVSPAGSALTQNSLVIGQYNNLNYSTQYPHIYAPDKVNCPNGDTTTDIIGVDYSIYTAIFMEYSIYNSSGDQFRAGTYTVAFKSTGTPVDNDNQTVVYSLTTLLATFTISVTGSIATIQLRNQDTDTYDIRVTARLLMR